MKQLGVKMVGQIIIDQLLVIGFSNDTKDNEEREKKRKEGVAVLTVENYALKRNGRDCRENFVLFRTKVGCSREIEILYKLQSI